MASAWRCCPASSRSPSRSCAEIGKADADLDGEVWLLAHERALRTPRVRAVYDFLGEALERRRAWFEGERVVEG